MKTPAERRTGRPLTVLQMVPDLQEGGVEQSTLEMARHLAQQGHASLVISRGGRLVSRLTADGSRHLTYPYVGEKSPRCLLHIPSLRRLIRQAAVDVLHLRSRVPAWVGYLAWRTLPPERRPALVTTFHGFYSINAYSAVMARGERIIAVSRTIQRHIQQAYGVPGRRIEVIYRGFDDTRFDPAAVGRERITALHQSWGVSDPAKPVILFPGRITRLKGHGLFIRALARIRGLPWTALCVGDLTTNPALVAELRMMAQDQGLGERIRFTGHCDDIPAALMLARVVAAPSIQPESFGRTAVEAQAMGKPVVAAAHGGSLETVRHERTGWLVPPGDPVAMADALSRALTDPERANAMGQAGRKWVRTRFNTRRMQEATAKLYQEVCRHP